MGRIVKHLAQCCTPGLRQPCKSRARERQSEANLKEI